MPQTAQPVAGITYEEGERVLSRFGWGAVIGTREETYPPPNEGVSTYECTIRLDKPSRLGETEIKERNPRRAYQFAVISCGLNPNSLVPEGSPTFQEFLDSKGEKAQAAFESERPVFGQPQLVILVNYWLGRADSKLVGLPGIEALNRPSQGFRLALFTRWWNIGEPKTDGPGEAKEFLEETSALSEFGSYEITAGPVLVVVLVDYKERRAATRLLTADGIVATFPEQN